jgi:hypothetical protein
MDFRKEFDLMLEVILHIRHGCEINARNASNEFQPATVNVMHPLPPPSMNAKDGAVAGLELEPLNKVLPQTAFPAVASSNNEQTNPVVTAVLYSEQGSSSSSSSSPAAVTDSSHLSSPGSSNTPANVTVTAEIPAFRPKRPLFMDRPPRPHQQRWRQPNLVRNHPPPPPLKPGGSRDYDYPSYPGGNNPPPMPIPMPGPPPPPPAGEDYGMPPPPSGNMPPNMNSAFRPRNPPSNPMIKPRQQQQNGGDMSNEQLSNNRLPPPGGDQPPPPPPQEQPARFIGGPRNEKLQKLKTFYPNSVVGQQPAASPPAPIIESPLGPEDIINNEISRDGPANKVYDYGYDPSNLGNSPPAQGNQPMPISNARINLPISRQKFSTSNQGIMPQPINKRP